MALAACPTPSAPPGHEDLALKDLQDFIGKHKIHVSSSLTFRRVPGRGIGIYSNQSIRAGERIMHVPSSALLTTACIPAEFARKELKAKLPVHVLLAAYIAFGMAKDDKEKLRPWMATWPLLQDFVASMPLFWPEASRSPTSLNKVRRSMNGAHRKPSQNRNPDEDQENATFWPIPPNLTGACGPERQDSAAMRSIKPKLLDVQFKKFARHVALVKKHFPDFLTPTAAASSSTATTPPSPQGRFTHAWANVNTRCFYHVAPGKRAPKDSNEAMALVPVMDLFNHSSSPNCATSYDRRGFSVAAQHSLPADQELLLSYGAHSNDMLWSEYGFVMDGNDDDSLSGFDEIVLASLSAAERELLSGAGYLGNYTLTGQGLCWRSEVVSWLGILSENQWFRFVEGALEPETVDRLYIKKVREAGVKKRKRNGSVAAAFGAGALGDDVPSSKARTKQISWLTQMKLAAECSLASLAVLGKANWEEEMLSIFTGAGDEPMFQDDKDSGLLQKRREAQARQRRELCMHRWAQILDMCERGIKTLQQEMPR